MSASAQAGIGQQGPIIEGRHAACSSQIELLQKPAHPTHVGSLERISTAALSCQPKQAVATLSGMYMGRARTRSALLCDICAVALRIQHAVHDQLAMCCCGLECLQPVIPSQAASLAGARRSRLVKIPPLELLTAGIRLADRATNNAVVSRLVFAQLTLCHKVCEIAGPGACHCRLSLCRLSTEQ